MSFLTPSGCSANEENKRCSPNASPAPRPRLFSSLWCLCVCLCVLRGVMGRFVCWECTTITHLLNGWVLMTHSRRHFGQGNIPSVAPMHAFRKEFAAIGCAIMVSLPQTAPDVPAAEIDPTAAELQQIGDVASILSRLGSGESVRVALVHVLNGDQPLLRVPADLWEATVYGPRIPQSEIQRDLTAPEVGYVAMVRRFARLRLGLTAHDEAGAAAHTLCRGLGFGGFQAEGVAAGSDSFLVTTAEPRLELSVLLELALDPDSLVLRRPTFWRCPHPTSSCEEPGLPKTSRPPCLPVLSLKSTTAGTQFLAFAVITMWGQSLNIFLLKESWEEWLCHAAFLWMSSVMRAFSSSPHFSSPALVSWSSSARVPSSCSLWVLHTTAGCPRSTSDCPDLSATVCRAALNLALVPDRPHPWTERHDTSTDRIASAFLMCAVVCSDLFQEHGP